MSLIKLTKERELSTAILITSNELLSMFDAQKIMMPINNFSLASLMNSVEENY